MKKIVFITLFAMITTVTAHAKQVEFESKFNTAYGCYGGLLTPVQITADLGKNSSQGKLCKSHPAENLGIPSKSDISCWDSRTNDLFQS